MEAAAADLLAALSSPSSHAGLYSRFNVYLQPFSPYLPTSNPNLRPPPKRATKQKKPPPPPDAATLRPLAKRFLPFIARALQLLPPLVRATPGSGDAGGGAPDELLKIYGILLDCLEAISPCLAGKPYSVLLQRGRYVCLLESRGKPARASVEAAAALRALCSLLSPPTTSTESPIDLPNPGSVGDAGRDPEVATLAVELTVCLANCAFKDKVKEADPYDWVLSLVKQLQPWLRILANDVSKKYLTLLVNSMSRCTLFLVSESSFFSTDLVHNFCVATIQECAKAQMSERLLAVDLQKTLNEFLLFVSYFSRCILSASKDLCIDASEILYKHGYSSEVSSPTASVLLLYATGFYYCAQKEGSTSCLSSDILSNQKYLQALDKTIGSLARMPHDGTSLMTYLDSLEFVCKVLLQHANAVWKNFSEGDAINYSGNMDLFLKTLHQFIDSSLKAYSCTQMSERDSDRLLEQRGTFLRVLVSAIKISFVTNKDVKESLASINSAVSSKWITLEERKFLISSLGNIGVALYNTGHVKEELLAYGLMETRGSTFCAEMQIRVIDVLLDEIYYSEEHCLERSRFLVRKAGALRACGVQNIERCLDSLSEAISLLQTISEDPSESNTAVINQLAIAKCLHAHCALEGNPGCEVTFENISSALSLWSKVKTFNHSSGKVLQQPSQTIIPLLCSLADLLAMKGCFKIQFDLCELMIKIWKQESLPIEKLFSLLFTSGRLSHTYCNLPLDKQFISKAAEHLGVDCLHTEFWRNCFEGEHPSLLMFLQRMLPSDLFFPQLCGSFDVSVDEVNKAALSLVSEATSTDQSTFQAGYLYYDLSERLFSCGKNYQALSYGKEALHLRKKLLKRKFTLNRGSSGNMESQWCGQDLGSLEAVGPTIAEIWPDSSKSISTRDSFLTSWNVLRCYLESSLQVAMMHELIGNGTEAEVLLRTGKEISNFHGLSFFRIAFTSLLGQLYSKRQLWNEADSELKIARDLLEHDVTVSCKLCKLTLEISVDMKVGDLFWSRFEKDFQKEFFSQTDFQEQSTENFSRALGIYQSAIEKLNSTNMEFLTGSFDSLKAVCHVRSKDCIIRTEHEVCSTGKETLVSKDSCRRRHDRQVFSPDNSVLPPCSVCAMLRRASVDHCSEATVLEAQTKNSTNAEVGPPLGVKAKRTSRNSSRSAKEQKAEINAKTRTRSSKRTAHVKGDEFPANALSCGERECFPDGIDHSKDDLCNMFGCWKCLLVESLNSGCIHNILEFRWDCVRRRYLVSLLLKTARALGSRRGDYEYHEVHNVYWQCISLLYFRSLPKSSFRTYEPHLSGLIMNGSTGDFLPSEHAEVLYSMSFILLKGSLSEQSRDICCCFSSVGISDVVPWLLKAFVLSRESPSLCQEVCKLLACTLLLSTIDSSIHLPLCSEKESLSLNRWAAYFHQMSVGTYHNYQYFATFQELSRKKFPKGIIADFGSEAHEDVSEFLRFPSMNINNIEKHIKEFFQNLPDVPVVCISMIGGDFVDILEGFLLLPSSFPAWMLLSRFDSADEPTTMLLPVAAISKETKSAGSSIRDSMRNLDKKWQCPWGYSITDYVAPSFKNILEENFVSLSSATVATNAVKSDHVRWWSHRTKLNDYLDCTLKDMEKSWFGPWKCLLLGHRLSDQDIEAALSSIIAGLKKHSKVVLNPALIKAILGGAASVDEVQECVHQLVLYKGYIGRGGCCGKDRLRAFSSCQIDNEALEILKCLMTSAAHELPEPVDRDPVILVLDANVQMLPWENLPVLRNHETYRMPSVGSIFFALSASNNNYKDDNAIASPLPVIDPSNTFYLLNPSGDLSGTQEEFHQLFRNYEWKGMAGAWDQLKAKELILALTNHDLFIYFGHGSGTQYVSGKEIEKLKNCAAALLMGCSSGTLHCRGNYAPRGAPLSYLFAGSPAIIANLWDVSDKDIDRFSKALLNSWLQEIFTDGNNCSKCTLLTQLESMNIAPKDNGRTRRKGMRGKKPQQINDSSKCCSCRQRRIASYLSEARRACRLPFLIGASPVCYGVPTIIRKKVMTDSASR
ncbi:unnamed protein product [Urochloa decumbens]|uniref:separase n=1 Tax=Urochloa decumbens TaxID=240449 RepID=A0ABC8ZSM6_9POAL